MGEGSEFGHEGVVLGVGFPVHGEHVDLRLIDPTTPTYTLETGNFGNVVEDVVPHLAFFGRWIFDGGVTDGSVGSLENGEGRHCDGCVVWLHLTQVVLGWVLDDWTKDR